MVAKKFQIVNPTGLHLRPAGMLCDAAQKYDSHITFKYRGENEANAKSVLSILGAGIKFGDTIELTCSGHDEVEAMNEIAHLFQSGFETN